MILQRNNPMRVTARAIVIRGGEVLLFKRHRLNLKTGRMLEYYSLPGGGVEDGESLEDAAIREMHEEMSVHIKIIQKVAIIEKGKRQHHIFWASIMDGEPLFNMASEEYRLQSRFNSYEVQWVDIDSLDVEMFRWGFEHIVPIVKNLSIGININEARLFTDK